MYALMKHHRGTATVVKTDSQVYRNMHNSGNYSELYTGTWKDCNEQLEEYLDERNEEFNRQEEDAD